MPRPSMLRSNWYLSVAVPYAHLLAGDLYAATDTAHRVVTKHSVMKPVAAAVILFMQGRSNSGVHDQRHCRAGCDL